MPTRKYTESQLKHMYNSFLHEPTDFMAGFNFAHFANQFETVKFKGAQSVKQVQAPDNKGGFITTVETATNPEWERDILNRLRATFKASGKSIEQIFREFDVDCSGTLSVKEFRNAMRKL